MAGNNIFKSHEEELEVNCNTLINIIDDCCAPLLERNPNIPAKSIQSDHLLNELLIFGMYYNLHKAYDISSDAHKLIGDGKINTLEELSKYIKLKLTETYLPKVKK